jgi:hypothetical protein
LDDFYEVGGNSLSAVRIVARCEKLGFSNVSVKLLRSEANVRAICQRLAELGGDVSPGSHSFDSLSLDASPIGRRAASAASSDDQPTALTLAAEDRFVCWFVALCCVLSLI